MWGSEVLLVVSGEEGRGKRVAGWSRLWANELVLVVSGEEGSRVEEIVG